MGLSWLASVSLWLLLAGLAGDGEDDARVLVRQRRRPPHGAAHQEDAVPAERAGGREDLSCSSASHTPWPVRVAAAPGRRRGGLPLVSAQPSGQSRGLQEGQSRETRTLPHWV